jgi:membrane protease subunit HflC
MFTHHHHEPEHHDHDDDHDHDHDERDHRIELAVRFGVAGLVLLAAIAAACIVMVPAGEAGVITRFGSPVRVDTDPGLAWKLPVPFESVIPIDLRLRTSSTGLQDVGTRDGLRVLVQAYVAWQVPSDPKRIRQFLRSVRNQPDEAARQLRSYVSAALHIISSNFDLTDLVNVDAGKVKLDAFEQQLREQVAPRLLEVYGIEIRQVGIERMTLPDETLSATVARMRAERETACARPRPFARTRTATLGKWWRRHANRRRRPKPTRRPPHRASMARRIAATPDSIPRCARSMPSARWWARTPAWWCARTRRRFAR